MIKAKNTISLLLFIFIFSIQLSAQFSTISKIEPPNWWTGFKNDRLQLMIYGENLNISSAKFNTESIEIINIINLENSDYAFIYLKTLSELEPDIYDLSIISNDEEINVQYEFKERGDTNLRFKGFNKHDVIYLIFPDRFVNGDTSNDTVFNSRDEFEFGSLNGRHGGDIAGISSKLDYLIDLGVTALWMTPMLENDMYMSYHGYAATNLYKIDPRFGTNESYKQLVTDAQSKGLKVIMDHVANHIGINHEWISSLPTEDWINGTPGDHLTTHHNKIAFLDIHQDQTTVDEMIKGWFTDYMPDLNQTNELLADYLIQNTIWWVELTGVDGIREDTYPYSDQKFMARWAKEILEEYPNFNIVGEVWTGDPIFLSKYQGNSFFPREFDSNLPAITDFGTRDAFYKYLSGKETLWEVYRTFAMDFAYSDPENLVVFLDNHDIDRAMFLADGDIDKYKIALTILLTARGIPTLFYGTEIGINQGGHHGRIRYPFPGGFENDSLDAFTKEGRSEKQNDIYDYLQRILNLRAEEKVITDGRFVQLPPSEGLYIYFKENEDDLITFVVNETDSVVVSSLPKAEHKFKGKSKFYDLLNNSVIEYTPGMAFSFEPRRVYIYKVK